MSNQTPIQNKIITDPSLRDLMDIASRETMLLMNCCHVATIQSFDSSNLTVTATINYKQTFSNRNEDGTYSPVAIDYPVIIDCPVYLPQGGTCALTMPISPGDTCLVIFNDRDLDNWLSDGATTLRNASSRLHSFSDGIALIGVRSFSNPITNYDPDRAVLRNGTTRVGVGESLVQIENNLYTLNELLQELINEVKSLVTQTAAITVTGVTTGAGTSGPPTNAATIALINTSITTTASKIAGLLE